MRQALDRELARRAGLSAGAATGGPAAAAVRAAGDAAAAVLLVPRRAADPASVEVVAPPPTGLATALSERRFVISVEIDPPRSVRIERTLQSAELIRDAGADLVNVSDSAMARVRMGALSVGFAIQRELGLEALIHVTTRDRNLMALESELLGAHALGIRDILALTGDPPRVGDYPGARASGTSTRSASSASWAGSTGARTRPAGPSAPRPASPSPVPSTPRRGTSSSRWSGWPRSSRPVRTSS